MTCVCEGCCIAIICHVLLHISLLSHMRIHDCDL